MSGADDWQWTAFDDVDRLTAAADLLEYCEVWRTPDGAEKMPPLTMQQAQAAVDTVLAFVTDSMRRRSGGS